MKIAILGAGKLGLRLVEALSTATTTSLSWTPMKKNLIP